MLLVGYFGNISNQEEKENDNVKEEYRFITHNCFNFGYCRIGTDGNRTYLWRRITLVFSTTSCRTLRRNNLRYRVNNYNQCTFHSYISNWILVKIEFQPRVVAVRKSLYQRGNKNATVQHLITTCEL